MSSHRRHRDWIPWWALTGGALVVGAPVFTLLAPSLHDGTAAPAGKAVQAPAACQSWLPAEHCGLPLVARASGR